MVRSVKTYWFYLLLPVCLMVGWTLSIQPETLADPIVSERVFLFDFCLFLPVLYFLYLRRDIGAKAAAIRAFALLGAGIWFVGFLLPVDGEILPALGLLRWIAVPILVAIELAAFVALVRYLYGSEPEIGELIHQGVPPIIARLLIAEARFWRRVFQFLMGGKNGD